MDERDRPTRLSYEDLARRESQRAALRKREDQIHRDHDWVHFGVMLVVGLLGLLSYFIAHR